MTHVANNLIRISIVTAAGFVGLFWSGEVPHDRQTALVSSAHAVIGRPLTPLSYAGVARRTTRRAVGAGAVYGGAVYGAPVIVAPPVVVAPVCAQVVNVYGQVTTVCR
jgi:hypothetical protein